MLKTNVIFLLLFCFSGLLQAQNFRGIYSYSKGLNKAQAHAYVSPLNKDSVFVYIHAVGPAPDFEPEWIKGWLNINTISPFLVAKKDTFYFSLTAKEIQIKHNRKPSTSFIPGIYRFQRVSQKQLPALIFPINPYWVKPTRDSVLTCYKTPSLQAESLRINFAGKPIQVVDTLFQFLLVEHPKHTHEFLWVPRQHCSPLSKK